MEVGLKRSHNDLHTAFIYLDFKNEAQSAFNK